VAPIESAFQNFHYDSTFQSLLTIERKEKGGLALGLRVDWGMLLGQEIPFVIEIDNYCSRNGVSMCLPFRNYATDQAEARKR